MLNSKQFQVGNRVINAPQWEMCFSISHFNSEKMREAVWVEGGELAPYL